MNFGFCPDDKPPRCLRFDTLPDVALGTVATLDEENNVLHIDSSTFDMLNDVQRTMILKMTASTALFDFLADKLTFV